MRVVLQAVANDSPIDNCEKLHQFLEGRATVLSRVRVTSVRPGILLGGKYRLDQPIGKGGMGWVWKAEQVQWGAPVAVKLIQPQLSPAPENVSEEELQQHLRRFLVEAKTAAAIRSPHVVQILDHGIDPELNWAYIVMELLDGETLEAKLERHRQLSREETVRIMLQVAKALSRLHEANLVHRDLKPGNIFLVKNDGEDIVKVLDFGIAKADSSGLDERPITSTGQQLGTPVYMSPEQIRGMPDVDFRADLWAFGVIAYECLVGERPFAGETLGDLCLKICAEPIPRPSRMALLPIEFDDWFERSVNRERQYTFTSAREAAERLELALMTRTSERAGYLGEGRSGYATNQPIEGSSAAFEATTVAATSTPELLVPIASSNAWSSRRWLLLAAVLAAVGGSVMFMRRGESVTTSLASDGNVMPIAAHPSALHSNTVAEAAPATPLPRSVHLGTPSPSDVSRGALAAPTKNLRKGAAEDANEKPSVVRTTSRPNPPRSASSSIGVTPVSAAPTRSLDDLIEDRY
jgi:eukaryotic-like serine/threonine-protein kinase